MDSANAASAVSPKKSSSLRQRVLSSVVLVPLVILVVWWSPWSIAVAVAAATLLATRELFAAFAHGGYHAQSRVGAALALAPVLAASLQPLTPLPLVLPAVILAIIASLVAALRRHAEPGAIAGWALTVAGALYIGGLFCYVVLLRQLDTPLRPGLLPNLGLAPGAAWLFLTLFVTWGQDVLAYFVGKYAGRTKMTPGLSPKKTWEGAVGGMAGAIGGGMLAVWLFDVPISLLAGALLGVVGGVIGPLGDLAESFIKRQVGVKDAGHLIPGHGGVLDRIDSLIFNAPVLYYLIVLLMS
jgi:phosphatidate cytidylyltransferase